MPICCTLTLTLTPTTIYLVKPYPSLDRNANLPDDSSNPNLKHTADLPDESLNPNLALTLTATPLYLMY